MIVNLPETTTGAVAKTLDRLRDEGGAVALGRVLTLIVDVGSREVETAVETANDASREHPCRVIVLVSDPARTGGRLDAEIRVGGDAGASEVVVLTASAELLAHADTLVMPLLLPDAPIVAWWPYEVPTEPSTHPVGAMAQRRITDTLECSHPLESLRRLRASYQEGDTDLAWTRLTVWRGLLSAALDQPPFENVTSAEVEGNDTHPSVVLLGAWLAHALRCPVTLNRSAEDTAVTRVVLHRASGPIVLDRPDGRTATIEQPGQPARHAAMPLRQLRECLSEELRRLDADEVWGEVLHDGLARIGEA
ncbi:glucose-6-phosphate dehydrogenase assembly protein OpcA [Actinotalea sp.]|uniref:glucose-6-phosphate dehydrogenase assembly protein OpcA n=1 Tax=Actinotalea sp. TaxID=1872145 RepID=UPI003564D4B9